MESAELELPEGIDAEEARMLEAAMLGVPYQGRIPDWNQQREPPVLSAEAQERLAHMQQQDLEFEESLAADRWVCGALAGVQAKSGMGWARYGVMRKAEYASNRAMCVWDVAGCAHALGEGVMAEQRGVQLLGGPEADL
jgi:hypothetical protein